MSRSGVRTLNVGAPRAPIGDASAVEELVAITPTVANEVGRNPRTVKRWMGDPTMKFPPTVRLRNRLYVSRHAFEHWKRGLLTAAMPA